MQEAGAEEGHLVGRTGYLTGGVGARLRDHRKAAAGTSQPSLEDGGDNVVAPALEGHLQADFMGTPDLRTGKHGIESNRRCFRRGPTCGNPRPLPWPAKALIFMDSSVASW
jgi:hypothetical protein